MKALTARIYIVDNRQKRRELLEKWLTQSEYFHHIKSMDNLGLLRSEYLSEGNLTRHNIVLLALDGQDIKLNSRKLQFLVGDKNSEIIEYHGQKKTGCRPSGSSDFHQSIIFSGRERVLELKRIRSSIITICEKLHLKYLDELKLELIRECQEALALINLISLAQAQRVSHLAQHRWGKQQPRHLEAFLLILLKRVLIQDRGPIKILCLRINKMLLMQHYKNLMCRLEKEFLVLQHKL